MIGIGLDLCQIARMEKLLQEGEGFLRRYFTQEEQEYIKARGKTGAQSMAAMYAAKEAFLKALGTGIGGGVSLLEVGVVHESGGRPAYRLTGEALEKMKELGANRAWLSLTHEAGLAAAMAVIE
ncbi:MAG: holo-ACP synthase [Candidatus Limiplasma sp.]|nr:holo-ACP synthase [Candidatus Limiplasma sp.]